MTQVVPIACKKQAVKIKGVSEDEAKDAENNIQEVTNSFIARVERHLELKDKEIMAV